MLGSKQRPCFLGCIPGCTMLTNLHDSRLRLLLCLRSGTALLSVSHKTLNSTPAPPRAEPCLNIFAAHPGVVSVSGTNAYDGHSIFDAYKSSCIDLYAPAGGLGQGLTVAYPESPSSYITIYDG